jgi:hypothetical protein
LHIFYSLLVCSGRTTTTKAGRGNQDTCQWLAGQVAIKTNRSDKTEIKKILKISGHQQVWAYEDGPWKEPGPPLLVAADLSQR